ncbi:uncharacterized protein Bfra_004336 [Botrytis fragariae]|uniref:Secreted protein n=1 Tax=Botrytis fragariae TaxID=1964551 RepID=A0A8H6AVR7_9HELO|nr:uncharacterized protein Bfra_004336 [Botrytis fragariae]KAF5874330.1 hypothetical protein Bfra_004336 [Botrytis fragariae]
MAIFLSLLIAGVVPGDGWLQPPHVHTLGAFAALLLRQGTEGFRVSVCIMRAACVVLNCICAGMRENRCASKPLYAPIWIFYAFTCCSYRPEMQTFVSPHQNPLEHTSQRPVFSSANLMLPNYPPTPKRAATKEDASRLALQLRRVLIPSTSTMPPIITT